MSLAVRPVASLYSNYKIKENQCKPTNNSQSKNAQPSFGYTNRDLGVGKAAAIVFGPIATVSALLTYLAGIWSFSGIISSLENFHF